MIGFNAMTPEHRIRHAAALFDAILSHAVPADRQMDLYFRAHSKLGMRDRGLIADDVYTMLRRRRYLAWLCGDENADASQLAAACLIAFGHIAPERVAGDASAIAGRVRKFDPAKVPIGVALDLPDSLCERFVAQWGEAEARALANALNAPAPLDLRVNTLRCEREQATARLTQEGFAFQPTPYSPVGLRRAERAPIFRTGAFSEGWVEVQDEGSQFIALLVEPRRREMVTDFCAGGGGKTLALGAMMANSGSLYAFDTSGARLKRLTQRVRRAGLDTVRVATIAHEHDDRVKRLAGKMDRVLVDAPCTGTGTLRRNPDIKWRPLDVPRYAEQQLRILTGAARLVKPGGRIVYATCSLLNEENDGVVTTFLAAHEEFRVVPVNKILERRGIALRMEDDFLRLFPHRHGTDGFFAAALERSM